MGNSQGGILGPTIAALEPPSSRFDRLALGVGGISYPIMLPRSCDWVNMPLRTLLSGAYPNPIDQSLLMVMFASHWDLFEGATFAPHIRDTMSTLHGSATPPDILFQIAVNDPGTPEVAGEIAARTMGLPYLASSLDHPSNRMPWGLAPTGASPTSALVSFDLGTSPVPDGPTVSDAVCEAINGHPEMNAHEMLRRRADAQAQIANFFDTGIIR